METRIRKLRVRDLILNRTGSLVFRIILAVFGIALQLFFRRIETVNDNTVPEGTGVIFVLNHPNGLIDPALVFVALPRRISFLAKSTLFRMPVISFLLRTVDALPVYRRIDSGEDVSQNLKTFEAARDLLRRGGSIAIFPEGVSHNSPGLLPIKTGAARIALGAASLGDEPIDIRIVPVGLFYTSKTTFRSEALLHFGDSFPVPRVRLDDSGDPPRDAVREVTSQIEIALRDVTLNAETDAEIAAADVAHSVFAADDEARLDSKLAFLRNYVRTAASGSLPPEFSRLGERLRRFDEKLDAIGIEPEHLSLARFSRGFVVRQAVIQTWYLVLLFPFAVFGSILHAPAYQVTKLLAHIYARHGADDVASTVKVLAGIIFMPLTWIFFSVAIYFLWNWQAALLSIPLSFLSGWIALVTLEYFEEYRGWAKAIAAFFADRDRFLRLYVERGDIQKDLRRLSSAAGDENGPGPVSKPQPEP